MDYEQDVMNYGRIKRLAKETGQRVNDLIVLAPQNDPFYVGTPGDWELGRWFADLWQQFYQGMNMHIRRVHYQIVSQDPPVLLPNGLPYENTENCWNMLNLASKAARYLGLVDPGAFNDRRNPEPVVFACRVQGRPRVRTELRLWGGDLSLPDFPELPGYRVEGYEADQPFHLEVWCEKSTMNDVLVPLCEQFGANLQTGLGELSITATLALVRRLKETGKPARIFYVSDFDPAGQSMPVAVSRKVEYFVRTFGLEVDVRVFPVILTLEQVQRYRLPRTPIKETERRRGAFEDRHGEGAVELDALEALYPGELRAVLEMYMGAYYDGSLMNRTREVREAFEEQLELVQQEVMRRYQPEVEALREEHWQLARDFEARMTGYAERVKQLWRTMRADLEREAPDPSVWGYGLPAAVVEGEIGAGLYESQRDYMDQVEVYKAFQGRG